MRRLFTILLFCFSAQAADVHCGVSAAGSGDGSNWSNQCAYQSETLVRGNTYYVADGSYTGTLAFSVANDGTTPINVIKATPAAHGSDTGWVDTMGDGRAIFSGSLDVDRAYLLIDGAVGGGPENGWDCEANCGFQFHSESVWGPACCGTDGQAHHITLRHVHLDGDATGPGADRTFKLNDVTDLTIQYSAITDAPCDLISGNNMDNLLVEYTLLARNHQAEPGCHGDGFEYQVGNASDFTFRYNLILDMVGTYMFGSHEPVVDGYFVYGNIFKWTIGAFFGNSLIGVLSGGGTIQNFKFYNNSLTGAFDGMNVGWGLVGGGTGNESRNNIYYNNSGSSFSMGFPSTVSANTCYNQGSSCNTNTTGNPFTNISTNDFSLTGASAAGTTLGSPYDEDMLGEVRGADGNWDRGALELIEGEPPPTPPGITLGLGGVGVTIAVGVSAP